MEHLTNSNDLEFTEVYSRIERTYNIGRFIVISTGIAVMVSVYLFQ
ncbi:hypothetical protein [Christiangramia crocea]|uniref:Uncharacterized protein n=1 Tax=Christiangramia crocea TaxID=2904124 RepID=A0A9X1UX86_9FLAO|nr:hypothetical protein [Gramella crocea]MCG9971964.1 hypothetical protein [Gramella crocea]